MRFLIRYAKERGPFWQNYEIMMEAADKEDLQVKIKEWIRKKQENDPNDNWSIQEIVCLSFRFVAQIATYDVETHKEKNRRDENLTASTDETAKEEAKNLVEGVNFIAKGLFETRLIKIIKITEEVLPLA